MKLPQRHRKPKAPPRKAAVTPPRRERTDDGNAFFPDPGDGPAVIGDDLAQELAEEYLMAATSGEDFALDERDQNVSEEDGGPFQPSSAAAEYAYDVDGSNPTGSTREGQPAPMRAAK